MSLGCGCLVVMTYEPELKHVRCCLERVPNDG